MRQVHSLTGVVPVGLFMLLQLWANAKAVRGAEAHAEALAALFAIPAVALWQVLVLGGLAFHALFGLWLVLRGGYEGRRPSSRSEVLQRVTGVIALVFIGYHALAIWLPAQRGAATPIDVHWALERTLSTTVWGMPLPALAYLVGVASCAFHLGNGLAAFIPRWKPGAEGGGRAWSAALGAIVGLVAFGMGASSVVYLATGWRFAGERAEREATTCGGVPATTAAEPDRAATGGGV